MKPIIPAAGRITLVLCVLVVAGLGIGAVSAAGTAHTAGNLTAFHGNGTGHRFAENSSRLHTGVGFNLTAGVAGNATHIKRTHDFALNATMQQERLQAFAAALEKKGIDESALETAIQNNDTAAEKAWVASYMQTHKEQPGNQTEVKKDRGFALNATVQQERLQAFAAALEKKGVDVSALETAIQNNDTAAEKTWFTTYLASLQLNNTTRQQWHPWNATASRSA